MSDLNSYRIFSFQSNKNMKFFGWKINEDTLIEDIKSSFIETFEMSIEMFIDEEFEHLIDESNVKVEFFINDGKEGYDSGRVSLINPEDDSIIYEYDFQIIEIIN